MRIWNQTFRIPITLLLKILAEKGAPQPSDLALDLQITTGGITGLCDNLEKKLYSMVTTIYGSDEGGEILFEYNYITHDNIVVNTEIDNLELNGIRILHLVENEILCFLLFILLK